MEKVSFTENVFAFLFAASVKKVETGICLLNNGIEMNK